jgi:hypothetical protein
LNGEIHMRSFLIFLSVLIVFVLVYYVFLDTIINKAKNSNYPQKSVTYKSDEYRIVKLSMRQIDSLTAFENYRFTLENYIMDSMPQKATAQKTTKI